MADVVKTRMTAEEYLTLPETNQIMELIDGEVIVSPSAKFPHQKAVVNCITFIDHLGLPGEIMIAPMDVHFNEYDVVQPDVFWVSADNPNCQLMPDDYWHGAPDLVIEILSPSTEPRDRGDKFNLYERYGVREYWLVNVQARFIEVFVLENGKFLRQGLYRADKTFTSKVLNGTTVIVKNLV